MVASTTGKLDFAVFPLATVLLGHGSSGSFLDAGIVAGAWSVGGTVTAPLRGRLVDRHGQRWPMGAMAVLTALAVAGLVTATATTQLVLSGALAGASAPPIVASTRSLWARAVPHDLLRGAYALEAVLGGSRLRFGAPRWGAGLCRTAAPPRGRVDMRLRRVGPATTAPQTIDGTSRHFPRSAQRNSTPGRPGRSMASWRAARRVWLSVRGPPGRISQTWPCRTQPGLGQRSTRPGPAAATVRRRA